jgi:hypothetical protein
VVKSSVEVIDAHRTRPGIQAVIPFPAKPSP